MGLLDILFGWRPGNAAAKPNFSHRSVWRPLLFPRFEFLDFAAVRDIADSTSKCSPPGGWKGGELRYTGSR